MRIHQVGRAALILALLLASSGLAGAEGEPPPLPQFSESLNVAAPSSPAVDAVLVDRIPDSAFSSSQYNSQDFDLPQDDSQAADDFCIPAIQPSWSLNQVDVVGGYNAVGYQPTQVKVFFMAKNAGAVPGTSLYAQTVSGASVGNAATGSFALTLPTPALLGGNNCYWLSVQAVQPSGLSAGQSWQWITYPDTTVHLSHSAYRKPLDPNSTCKNWALRAIPCAPANSPYPDFTYQLSGSVGDNLTPVIESINPPGGLNESINLGLSGRNFAVGATISWTVNSTTHVFTPTVIDGSHLNIIILAEHVGPQGAPATVQVNNPAPCQGGVCHSNAMPFILQKFYYVYMPIVLR